MPSLRDRKKRETSIALALAAYSEALEHGVENVTTGRIAERAGVSRRTFANYYANKHTAVVDGFMLQAGLATWRADSTSAPHGKIPETFVDFLDVCHAFVTDLFHDPDRLAHISDFVALVKATPSLEPFLHAVVLEFDRSPLHSRLVERFGAQKVALFLGALTGSIGSILRIVLGPQSLTLGGQVKLSPSDFEVALARDYIDQAFIFLRYGFGDSQ